jgi:hypothetical protein
MEESTGGKRQRVPTNFFVRQNSTDREIEASERKRKAAVADSPKAKSSPKKVFYFAFCQCLTRIYVISAAARALLPHKIPRLIAGPGACLLCCVLMALIHPTMAGNAWNFHHF